MDEIEGIHKVWSLMTRGIVVENKEGDYNFYENYKDAFIKTGGYLKENGLRKSIQTGKLYKKLKVRRFTKKEAEDYWG